MSHYTVLSAVNTVLRDILWEAFQVDGTITQFVSNKNEIGFMNPTQTAILGAHQLSLWLYQIAENEYLRNESPIRTGTNGEQFPPLALNLFFLVTPFAGNNTPGTELNNYLLLGKTMQVLYDNAILLMRGSNPPLAEELRILLARVSLEELTRVWDALREPYRLSVCYEIRVTRVDSQRIPQRARVVEIDNLAAPVEAPAAEASL